MSPEKKRQHFATPLLVSLQNNVQGATKKFPYWWCITSRIWVVLLIGWSKLSINPKHYPDLGGNTLSEWNFFGCSSDVISGGNPWWHFEMISAFSKVKKWEYQIIFPRLSRKAKRSKNKLQIQFPLSVSPNNNNNIILFKHDKITAVLYLKIKHSLQMNRKFKN